MQPPPPDKPPLSRPQTKSLPFDFVLCIDNSASMGEREQVLVREIAMLLADLADEEDKVSIIGFGSGANGLSSRLITGDEQRRAFKSDTRETLTFQDRRSDIRAGLDLLADTTQSWFRPPGQSRRVAVVLSDGRLEPQDGDARTGLEEIRRLVSGPLAKVELYSVALGNEKSLEPIPGLDGLTGVALMREIARSPDRFLHATRLDDLLRHVVTILRSVKGTGALEETSERKFKVDKTVELLLLVLPKRLVDGTELCPSSDIRLKVPGVSEPQTFSTRIPSIYWATDYQYFDLIQARKPEQGNWQVEYQCELPEPEKLRLLTKVVTPIDIRYEGRSVFWLNEDAGVAVWLYDKAQRKVSHDPAAELYRVQLKRQRAAPSDRVTHTPLRYDPPTGRYLLDVPSELGDSPGPVTVRFVAEMRDPPGKESFDPWFRRETSDISFVLAEPFVDWQLVPALSTRVPLFSRLSVSWSPPAWLPLRQLFQCLPLGPVLREVRFAANLAPAGKREHAPVFLSPPTVSLESFQLDEDTGKWRSLAQDTVSTPSSQGRYDFERSLSEPGVYRYRYRLTGTTDDGTLAVNSPLYSFQIESGWWYWLVYLVLLLLLLNWLGKVTARMSVTLEGVEGVDLLIQLQGKRGYEISELQTPEGNAKISLRATRCLFVFRKRIVIRVHQRTFELCREQYDNEGEPYAAPIATLNPGAKRAFAPGQYLLRADDAQWRLDVSM